MSWLVLRLGCGWVLLVHGWGKVTRGPAAYYKGFSDLGFEPAALWSWAALFIEFGGGISLIRLFTRFFAAAVAFEMLIITYIDWNNGFSWLNRGYEFVLLRGACSLRDQSWLRDFGQDDKWNFCLTAGTLCPTNQEIR